MKTLMTSATLLPLLIACGGPTQTHADAEAPIECVYSVRGTDAALVSRALNAVLQNQVDPCAGAVDMVSRNIQLERIDQSVDAAAQRVFLLVFNVSRLENSAPGHLNSMRQNLQ
jgi:hypothetical protein